MSESFAARVRVVLGAMAVGEVLSYGEVAAEAGSPGAARAVGMVLRHGQGLPWWRVVNAAGRLAPGHEREQARLLRAEGARVRGNRVEGFGRNRRESRPWRAS